MTGRIDYWRECIEVALNDAGVVASQDQIERIAGDVESAHENYGMAFPRPSYAGYRDREVDELKEKLSAERRKVVCRECNGTGYEFTFGPSHSSTSQCHKCKGEGKHA